MKLSRVFAATLSIICATIGINAQRNYSREAFINDLDTLVYLIEDVEVAPYSQLDKSKFYATVDSVKASLTGDSVSILDAYRTVARLTGMFNQGHLRTRIPDDVANPIC